MSHFALQLAAGAKITFASAAAIESSTALWCKMLIKGSALNALDTTPVDLGIDYVGTANYAFPKAGLIWQAGSHRFGIFAKDFLTYTCSSKAGVLDVGDFDDDAYYWLQWRVDEALGFGITAHVSIFEEADPALAVELAVWYTSTDIPLTTSGVDMSVGAGTGVRIINPTFNGGVATAELVVDEAQMGVDSSYSVQDAPLDEGTGTSVSPSGTISGGAVWIDRGDGPTVPDHGVVSLPSSTLRLYPTPETMQPTVTWYDAFNVPLSPQPSTVHWSVNSLALSIDSDTGEVTAQAAGRAKIRARVATLTASSSYCVVPPTLALSGTIAITTPA